MFCKKCGANIPDDEDICPYCEEPVDGRHKKPERKQEDTEGELLPLEVKLGEKKEREFQDFSFENIKKEEPVDHGSIGYAILGFFVPIVGLILFLVWKNEKPTTAKQCGIGALIGFVLALLFYGAAICCIISVGNNIGRV